MSRSIFVRQPPPVPAIHGARRRRSRCCTRRPCCARKARAVKVGVLHPVSGALSYSGQQGRIGAQLAIDEINAAGGIKALGGAKIEAVLGDAQSTPEGGNAEVEKMNAAGVAADRRRLCQRASASPPARPRRATTCPMSSTSAWSTASSRAA